MDEHTIPLEELFKRLNSSENGLTSKQAKELLKKYGGNVLQTKKNVPLIFQFLLEFVNFFALLLIVGATLSFIGEFLSPGEGNLYIGIALSVVVVLNAVFTFIQKYQSEKIMDSFKNMLPSKVDVLRDGKRQEILAEEVVPGDIIFVEEGDKVPADARLIEANILKVDHSSITGEAEPQLRDVTSSSKNILESRNMLFSGTLVQTGNGKAIVYGTGMNTEIGKIVKLTKETKEVLTPLHKELNHFIKIISYIALGLGFSFFIISLFLGQKATGSLIFAIGIIVANVPEGLLPTVTLSLTMAAKKMAKKNALIKNLESVETLGSTTVICTDKTGTITQNKMSVNTLILNLKEMSAYENDLAKTQSLDVLVTSMALCNNAKFDKKKCLGDPTETSILEFSNGFIPFKELLEKNKRLFEVPFDSVEKRMITIHKMGKTSKKQRAYLKGAPEVVLKKCSKILLNNSVRKITSKDRNKILSYYKILASRGERVLGFAYKDLNISSKKVVSKTAFKKTDEKEFVFIGLSGMIDPPKEGITEAIEKCHTAGIKVVMITGDFSLTAEAIGRKVGLIAEKEKANVLTGEELLKYSDAKLKKFLKKDNIIFARTSPEQKLRIVKAFQSLGEVVTVTGDGVNDAPALKNADMGVSMGIGGTEVAREASDMILMDDNFATIVTAVEEGRTIFDNIKKFIAYILTSNVPEITPFLAYVLLGIPLPLTVVLILSIDLGTDLLPALGLGSELPESDVMKKKPRARNERLLTGKLLFMSYGIIGLIQATAGFFAYFFVLFRNGWQWGDQLAGTDPIYRTATTAFFVSIIICQMADVWICRTRRESVFSVGIKNKMILLGIASEILIISLIVYTKIGNTIFGTAPLSPLELLLSVPFALFILFGDEVRKIFVRRGNKFVLKYLNW